MTTHPEQRDFQAVVHLSHEAGHRLDVTVLVTVDSPDGDHPIADEVTARRAALDAVRPFLVNKANMACEHAVEVTRPDPVPVTMTEDQARHASIDLKVPEVAELEFCVAGRPRFMASGGGRLTLVMVGVEQDRDRAEARRATYAATPSGQAYTDLQVVSRRLGSRLWLTDSGKAVADAS